MPRLLTTSDLLAAPRRTILNLLPEDLAEVTQKDAEYHAEVGGDFVETNQIHSFRNKVFHQEVLDEVCRDLKSDAVILEIGSFVGLDAAMFLERCRAFRCFIVSDISPRLMEYAEETTRPFQSAPVVFCCLDAGRLAIEANQVDVLFMIATLHHLPSLGAAIREFNRVTKTNARLIFGLEPNHLWLNLIARLRPLYRALFMKRSHSAADEAAEGFTCREFQKFATNVGWRVEKIIPVWLATGFFHYGLEFFFRLLRLRKRIQLPAWVDRAFIAVDTLLFSLPFTKNLAWHYTVVCVKSADDASEQ